MPAIPRHRPRAPHASHIPSHITPQLAPAYASAAVTAALLLGAAAALAGAPCREEVEVVDGLGVLLTSGTTPGHYSCNAGTSTSTSTSGDDGSDGSGGSGGSSSGRGLHAWLAPPLLAALRPLGLHPGGGRQQRFLELEAVRDVALVEVMTSCDVAFHLVLERADGRGLVQAFPGVRPPLAVLRPMFRALAPRL